MNASLNSFQLRSLYSFTRARQDFCFLLISTISPKFSQKIFSLLEASSSEEYIFACFVRNVSNPLTQIGLDTWSSVILSSRRNTAKVPMKLEIHICIKTRVKRHQDYIPTQIRKRVGFDDYGREQQTSCKKIHFGARPRNGVILFSVHSRFIWTVPPFRL